jgi:ABC-type sugar transport system ATPase subunit
MTNAPWLVLKGIQRHFGSIKALKGVDITINRGEVLGLVGENGAGKSTLMKIMSGFDGGFTGEVLVDGRTVELGSPKKARALGIAIAQQELSLIPTLSVAENIFLGGDHGPTIASLNTLSKLARPFLDEVGLNDIDPKMRVHRLSVGESHLVEVARLVAHNPQLLILDEPTAALSETDSERILNMVNRLKENGKSVIYVSHRLDEIFKIADRVTVLRDGASQATKLASELDVPNLVTLMLGRELSDMFPPKNPERQGKIAYKICDLWPDGLLSPISFSVKKGEILGLAGQLGSGAGEILASIAGAHSVRGGQIVDMSTGKSFLPKSSKAAIDHGIAYCSPDRKHDGLFLGRPISENLTSPNLKRISNTGILNTSKSDKLSMDIAKAFTIDPSRLPHEASVLSGGNQQKVALGKWLSINPGLMLVDEPTRGVDVGARAEIYQKLVELAESGVSIIVASTDLLEIAELPSRVLTFYKGALTSELEDNQVNTENILKEITNPEKFLQLSGGEL